MTQSSNLPALPPAVTPGNALALNISTEAGLAVAFKVAEAFAQSGMFKDARQASQAFAKIVAGQELGLGPAASMAGIHTIEGKMSPSSNLVATLIIRSGVYRFRVVEETKDRCVLRFLFRERDGWEEIGTSEFTHEEARAAELLEKANWRKYPKDMLFARALMRGARRYCADVFGGQPIYSPDELGLENIGPNGDVIIDDASAEQTEKERADTREQYLVDLFGRDALDALLTKDDGTRVPIARLADDKIFQRAEAELRVRKELADAQAAATPGETDTGEQPEVVVDPETGEVLDADHADPDELVQAEQEVDVDDSEDVSRARGDEDGTNDGQGAQMPPPSTLIPDTLGPTISDEQRRAFFARCRELGIDQDRELQLEIASRVVGRTLASRNDIPRASFDRVLDALAEYAHSARNGG